MEGPVGGDGEGIAGGYGDRGYGGGVGVGGATPDLAAAFKDVPDFFDLLMAHGAGDLACGEDDFDHAGFLGVVAVVEEQAYLGAVGGDGVGVGAAAAQGRRPENPWGCGNCCSCSCQLRVGDAKDELAVVFVAGVADHEVLGGGVDVAEAALEDVALVEGVGTAVAEGSGGDFEGDFGGVGGCAAHTGVVAGG